GRVDEQALGRVPGVDPRPGEGQPRRPGPGVPEVPGLEVFGHGCIYPLPRPPRKGNKCPRRNDTRDDSRASLQEARRSRFTRSGADLLDEAILRLEDDVLDVEGIGARLVHAVSELEVDGLDDLA